MQPTLDTPSPTIAIGDDHKFDLLGEISRASPTISSVSSNLPRRRNEAESRRQRGRLISR